MAGGAPRARRRGAFWTRVEAQAGIENAQTTGAPAVEARGEGVGAAADAPAFTAPSMLTRWAVVFLAALFLAAAARLAPYIFHPYPLDASDGGMLSSAWHVVARGSIYNAIDAIPFVFNIHGPLFIHLSALVFHVAGPHPAGPRLLGAAMLMGAAAFTALSARRVTGSTGAGLVAGFFLLVERNVLRRSGLATCDYAALLLVMMGVYFWICGGRRRYAAAGALALAFFAKQSAVLVPPFLFAAYALEGRRRAAAGWTALWAAALAAGFAAAALIWGRAFFDNVLGYGTVTSFSTRKALASVVYTPLYYPAAVFAVAWCARRALAGRVASAVPALAAAGFVNAFLMGNDGASRSYGFTLAAGMALSLGVLWPRIVAWTRSPRALASKIAWTALAAQALFIALAVAWHAGARMTHLDREAGAALAAVYDEPGIVLSPLAGYDAGRAGRNFTTDPHRLSRLLAAGVVRREALVDAVRRGAFSAVVVPPAGRDYGIFDSRLLDAVEANYQLRAQTALARVYGRPAAPDASASRGDASSGSANGSRRSGEASSSSSGVAR